MEKPNFIIPKLEDLYVGQIVHMLDSEVAWNNFIENKQVNAILSEDKDYAIHVSNLFKLQTLTKSDLEFYKLNPNLIERELRIETM